MKTRLSHFKLGLLAAVAIAGLVIAAFALGIRALNAPSVDYHTYFDESVQGLDLGAAVKFRGVTIGSVSKVAVAPDRRRIDVTLRLDTSRTRGLEVTPEMRAQLATLGITGVKFIDIDVVDPVKQPPPTLTFQPPENYIPAQTSLIEGLRANLEAVGPQFPEVMRHANVTFEKLEHLLDEVRDLRILENLGGTAENLAKISQQTEQARLPARTAATLAKVDRTATKLTGVLTRFEGDRGLVAGTQRAIQSVADLGRRAAASSDELAQTLRDLGDAARSVRDLAEEIERDPDMLLKGRPRTARRR